MNDPQPIGRIGLSIVLLLLTISSSALAAEALPKAEVDRLVQPLIDGEWNQSIVVGLIGPNGEESVYGYGKTSAGANGKVPDGNTIYEIGSITKAFTGVLLADMVTRGEVTLDDPVQKYLPDTLKLPQKGERPITLADLSSNRSGLPRMPSNFQPKDPANPYADYTVERMYAFLKDWKPARAPGEQYEYSNLGVGLLGHALSRKAGKEYEALLTERVLKPLGMGDSSIALSDDQRKRLAPPYDAGGTPSANWDIPTFAGAGALRSTVHDMMKFARAGLKPGDDAVGKAMTLSQKRRADASGPNGIGLGWHINSVSNAIWHNGETGGYHSYLAIVPGKAAVVMLTNNGSGISEQAGLALLMAL